MLRAALKQGSARLGRASDQIFAGEVTPWIYAALRIGFALTVLVRHSDWLRPWWSLEHHQWVSGLDFVWTAQQAPFLISPLIPGLAFDAGTMHVLAYARTLLALLLLVGLRPRAAALLLALVSYALMASDRYRYFHHLHLLYVSLAGLSLAPLGDRLSVERLFRRTPPPSASPLWPLQLLRGVVLSIYLAAGIAKLRPEFFDGETFELLARSGMLGGRLWAELVGNLGYRGSARLICLFELTLPILLAFRRTRRLGVVAAMLFHAGISATMGVSTFGVQMALLLVSFWPESRPGETVPSESALACRT